MSATGNVKQRRLRNIELYGKATRALVFFLPIGITKLAYSARAAVTRRSHQQTQSHRYIDGSGTPAACCLIRLLKRRCNSALLFCYCSIVAYAHSHVYQCMYTWVDCVIILMMRPTCTYLCSHSICYDTLRSSSANDCARRRNTAMQFDGTSTCTLKMVRCVLYNVAPVVSKLQRYHSDASTSYGLTITLGSMSGHQDVHIRSPHWNKDCLSH